MQSSLYYGLQIIVICPTTPSLNSSFSTLSLAQSAIEFQASLLSLKDTKRTFTSIPLYLMFLHLEFFSSRQPQAPSLPSDLFSNSTLSERASWLLYMNQQPFP